MVVAGEGGAVRLEGAEVGGSDGSWLGFGLDVGTELGKSLGCTEGPVEGEAEGGTLGSELGNPEGEKDDGAMETDGGFVGFTDGELEGIAETEG